MVKNSTLRNKGGKAWPVQSTCKLIPKPKAKMANTCSGVALFMIPMLRIQFFIIPGPKIPLSLPAPKREYGIFGPGMMKNRIRNMGIKRASPEHMFNTLASGGNLHVLWTGQLLSPLLCNILFHHTWAENTTFAFRSRERKWYFRPGYGEK